MTSAVLALPKWVMIVRGFQLFFSLVVLGISAYGVYWIAFNSWGFAIFTSLATIIIVLYGILTNRITAWHSGYNYWAVLALDIFGVVFWLASMGALAATRAAFIFPTTISGCGHSGDIGGGYCFKRRQLESLNKRDAYVASYGYLNLMSGAAGVSAINFILFVVTLVMVSVALHRQRKSDAPAVAATNDKEAGHPMEPVQQQVPVHQQPQYTGPPQQPQQPYQQVPVQYQQQQYQQAPPQQYPQ